MIHEFTLVLDREPAETELRALAVAGLDQIGTEGQHPISKSVRQRAAARGMTQVPVTPGAAVYAAAGSAH